MDLITRSDVILLILPNSVPPSCNLMAALSASSIISPPASNVMAPVPDDATVIAAFEPFAAISFVVNEPAVMLPSTVKPTLVNAPLNVPVVAVKAPI